MSDFTVKNIEFHSDGFKALLQSQEIMSVLLEQGEKMGTVEDSFVGFDRCHVVVKEN